MVGVAEQAVLAGDVLAVACGTGLPFDLFEVRAERRRIERLVGIHEAGFVVELVAGQASAFIADETEMRFVIEGRELVCAGGEG